MTDKLPEKGSRMLRKGRVSWSGCHYFVSSAKAKNSPTLDNPICFEIICSEARRLEKDGLWECNAFVLMPDHLHMLIRLGEGADLSRVINLFKGRSAFAINRARNSKGPVWFRGFHDHLIRPDQPIPNFLQYLLRNPAKAGLSKIPANWPYLFVKSKAHDLR
jgi:REP element-mobilizing transposase RayT